MLALNPDRCLPCQPEPSKVLKDSGDNFRAAAGLVSVLNPQKKTATRLFHHALVQECRIGMAQMQPPIGTWRKAEDGYGHANVLQISSRKV